MLAALLTPFVLALLFALILEPPVSLLAALYGSRRPAALLVCGLFWALLLAGVGLGAAHLFAELQKLPGLLAALPQSEGWPLLGSLQSVGAQLAGWLAQLLRATPSAMVAFFVTLFATYYLCAEPELPLRTLCLFAPASWRGRLKQIYRRARASFSAYLRAQAVVMLASTLWAMLGLYLLGVEPVWVPGLLIGLCDLLPVLGPGTLLLPWAVLSLAQGESRLAAGLVVIYVVILLSRQFIEPKIMAAGLGLHPLAALAASFAGLTLLGGFGLLLGPLLASLGYFIFRESRRRD